VSPLVASIRYRRSRLPGANIVVVGNSTSSVANGNWPATFAALRPQDGVTNSAAGGETTQYFIANFSSLVTPFKSTTLSNEIIFFEGANLLVYNYDDGAGHVYGVGWTSGASAYPKTAEFCAIGRANGWLVRVVTLDYWNDPDYAEGTIRTAFDQYNAAVRANSADYDGLIDLALTGEFDPNNDPNNYYADDVHKTSAGNIRLGQLIAAGYAVL